MLDSLHQFLYDARLYVCLVTVPVGLYSGWRCFTAITGPASEVPPGSRTTRRMPSRPPGAPPKPPGADKPVQQQLITDKPAGPASVEAGKESRLNKALASTIRIDTGDARSSTGSDVGVATRSEDAKPTVADEVNQLFAGLDDKLQPSGEAAKPKATPEERTAEALAKAGRLEQLGFHRPSQPDGTGARVTSDPGRPIEAAKGPELDDILAKLDKVLADKPAASPSVPLVPSTTTPTAAKAPLWARADATDEDADAKPEPGKQLGLFEEGKDKPKT